MSFSFDCRRCGYPLEVYEELLPEGRFMCPKCHQRYSVPQPEESVREQATQSILKAKSDLVSQQPAAPLQTQSGIQTKPADPAVMQTHTTVQTQSTVQAPQPAASASPQPPKSGLQIKPAATKFKLKVKTPSRITLKS